MLLPTPTLHTARLLLRPFTEADTDAIFSLLSNPHVLRYWDAPPWKERAQAERFIARCKQAAEDGSAVPPSANPQTASRVAETSTTRAGNVAEMACSPRPKRRSP